MRECDVDGCDKRHAALGYCGTHYMRLRRYGSTDDPRPSAEERFWSFVEKNPDTGCWEWTGNKARGGYARFRSTGGPNVMAHRWSYEHYVGPIPEGLQIDHLCRVRNCVNPEHLEPVTCRENLLRGDTFQARNARKTHCKRGHPFDEANTYVMPTGRECRACRGVRKREHAAAAAQASKMK